MFCLILPSCIQIKTAISNKIFDFHHNNHIVHFTDPCLALVPPPENSDSSRPSQVSDQTETC